MSPSWRPEPESVQTPAPPAGWFASGQVETRGQWSDLGAGLQTQSVFVPKGHWEN